jgi:mono/diheme cytochrome c family protein
MKEPEILAQQQRENPEPHERSNPIPWPMGLLVAAMLAFGIVYIASSAGEPRASSAKVDGAALYASVCAACHQATGQGLPGVFPPLAGSEWVNGNEATLAAIVLHGVNGPLTVMGSSYSGAMPAFKQQLDDAQIAAVLSHLRSQWGNGSASVEASTVAKVRDATKTRGGPFAGGEELKALP